MSESKNKTGIKTKRNVVAAEKKTATAVKKAAAVVKRQNRGGKSGKSQQSGPETAGVFLQPGAELAEI